MQLNRRLFLHALAAFALTACTSKPKFKLPADTVVLALGDSLTDGQGAVRGEDYPSRLAQLTQWKVINGGVRANRSDQALARLPELMKQQPKLVLIELGVNDFFQKKSDEFIKTHIGKIIETARAGGAEPVLMAMPYTVWGETTKPMKEHPLYAEIARQYHVPLLSHTWTRILSTPELKSDYIHANAEGYRKLAEEIADFLQQQGY